jgi:hypothetical protein
MWERLWTYRFARRRVGVVFNIGDLSKRPVEIVP